jgi:hypothetical protein
MGLCKGALASVGEDAELLEFGERCKVLALETRRLGKLFERVVDRTEKAFYAMKPERWCCEGYMGSGRIVSVPGMPNTWQVFAIDGAPYWFDINLGIDAPERLPTKWIRLAAKSETQAKDEARALNKKFDEEFFGKREQAGVPFGRDAHYKNWTRSHNKLRLAVAHLARLRATTPQGLNIKAMVLAIAHDAFDDPDIWNAPLQRSIMRDIKRMVAA